MARTVSKAAPVSSGSQPDAPPRRRRQHAARPASSAAGPGAMARFSFADGRTLEVHVPGATAVDGGESAARAAGFVLRRGPDLLNVGPLVDLLTEQVPAPRPRRKRDA